MWHRLQSVSQPGPCKVGSAGILAGYFRFFPTCLGGKFPATPVAKNRRQGRQDAGAIKPSAATIRNAPALSVPSALDLFVVPLYGRSTAAQSSRQFFPLFFSLPQPVTQHPAKSPILQLHILNHNMNMLRPLPQRPSFIPTVRLYPECRNKITSPSCTIYSLPSNRTCAFSLAAAILPAASKSLHFTTSARINPFSMSL